MIRKGYAEDIQFSNVICESNGQYGLQCGTDNIAIPGPITFVDCGFKNNTGNGCYFKSTANLTMLGCQFTENTADGFAYSPRTGCATDAEVTGILLDGCIASNNTEYGVTVDDAVNGHHVQISIANHYTTGNSSQFWLPASATSRDHIRITNVGPPLALNVSDGFVVSEATYINITGNLTTLTRGTCGQILTMRFWGSWTVTHSIVTDGFDLAGGVNFVGVAGNTLSVCWMTGQWREIGRSVA